MRQASAPYRRYQKTVSAYLGSIYQDQVVGSGYTTNGGEVGFTWSAGKYTIVSAVNTFAAVSDNGLAVGFAKGSNTSYVTYNLVTGALNAFQFAPSQGNTVSLSDINSSGVVSATQRVQTGIHSYTCQAFVQSPDGSYSIIDPAKDELVSLGVTDSGVVLVAKTSSRECPDTNYSVGLYRNGKLRKYSIANGRDVNLFFVEGDGVFGGNYINTVANDIEGFTATGGKAASYSVPGNNTTTVTSEGPPGQYAGYSVDASVTITAFSTSKRPTSRLTISARIARSLQDTVRRVL